MDATNKYFTVEEYNAGAVLGLRTKNTELKFLNVFREKPANYTMQNFKNPGYVVAVVRDMDYPSNTFENKHMPKDLNEDQENPRSHKRIQEQTIKVFVTKEMVMKSNIRSIYGLIWGQCTYSLHYPIRNDEDYNKKSIDLIVFGSRKI